MSYTNIYSNLTTFSWSPLHRRKHLQDIKWRSWHNFLKRGKWIPTAICNVFSTQVQFSESLLQRKCGKIKFDASMIECKIWCNMFIRSWSNYKLIIWGGVVAARRAGLANHVLQVILVTCDVMMIDADTDQHNVVVNITTDHAPVISTKLSTALPSSINDWLPPPH